jgi:pyruvate/2-oxoglutarate/acetoin dehydrogenase E1 component
MPKALLKAAIRDDNPVLYFENKDLFGKKVPCQKSEFLTPIGKAKVVREGTDVTIVSYSIMLAQSH